MTARYESVPLDGTPPAVAADDPVEVRDAAGDWHPMTAVGPARYDYAHAIGRRCYLTVPVAGWGDLPSVNWPAEDVRPR